MNSMPPNAPGRMQRDLRIWWSAISVVGFTGWLGLFVYPGMTQFRPFLLLWLVVFVVIGVYQRRKTLWPPPPPEGLDSTAGRQVYRASLERRRDDQFKWPARQPVVILGTVVFSVLVGVAVFLQSPKAGLPLILALAVPVSVVVLVLGLHFFTRRFTDRAAAAFQREIDDLLSNGHDSDQG
jgi:hypothetical protein